MSPAASNPVTFSRRRIMTYSKHHRRTSGPIRRPKGGWTPEEDEILGRAVELHKGRSWKKIAESIPHRTEVQCLHRWQKVINPELVKGSWTPLEDGVIIELVAQYGPTKWSEIAKALPGRIGNQCRERWHNHLNPEIRKDSWTLEEEIELMKAHIKHGNKWAEIAKVMHGRTDNSIKNHWNSSLRKKLDYYLRTGNLPVVQGTSMLNTALETYVENAPATACNVSSRLPVESSKVADQHDSVNPLNASVADSQQLRTGKAPPVQRTGILHTAQDTGNLGARQLNYCSNVLEIDVKNVPDTECTVSSSLPVESTEVVDQHDSVNPLIASGSDSHSSRDVVVGESDSSGSAECNAQVSEIVPVPEHNTSDSGVKYCNSNGKMSQNEKPSETTLCSVPSNISFLCYKPPRLEDHIVSGPLSYIAHFTPFLSCKFSSEQSIESFLKVAARSFPNTPSIIKRKEACTPLPSDIMQSNEIRKHGGWYSQ